MASPTPEDVPDVAEELRTLAAKVDAVQLTLNRMRRAAYIRLAVTLVAILIPLIGLIVTLPRFLAALGGLGNPTALDVFDGLQ